MTSGRKGAGFGSPAFEWVAGMADGILVLPVGRPPVTLLTLNWKLGWPQDDPMQLSLLPPKLSPKKGPSLVLALSCTGGNSDLSFELPRGLVS